MKKLLCSILTLLFIVGCTGLFPVSKANINIKNCDPDVWVGVAYFTEYDKYNDPTEYVVLEDEIKGIGEIVIEAKPGRYIITYFKPNLFGGVIVHFDDVTLKPDDSIYLSYGCKNGTF